MIDKQTEENGKKLRTSRRKDGEKDGEEECLKNVLKQLKSAQ